MTDDSGPDERALAVLFEISTAGAAHWVSYYLYFSSEEAAAPAVAELHRRGFNVQERLSADDIKWLVLAHHEIVPTEERLAELRQSIEELAVSTGGEYDGWEALVE